MNASSLRVGVIRTYGASVPGLLISLSFFVGGQPNSRDNHCMAATIWLLPASAFLQPRSRLLGSLIIRSRKICRRLYTAPPAILVTHAISRIAAERRRFESTMPLNPGSAECSSPVCIRCFQARCAPRLHAARGDIAKACYLDTAGSIDESRNLCSILHSICREST